MTACQDASEPTVVQSVYGSISYSFRALVLGVLGAVPFLGFPIWWGLLIAERHYDLLSFGLAQTAQLAGWVTTNLLLLRVLSRTNRSRVAALSFATMGVLYLAVVFVHDVRLLIVLLGVLSAASAATASLAAIYLGHTPNPERQYSIQVTATTITQSIIVVSIPYVSHVVGVGGIQLIFAVLMLIAAFVVRSLPGHMPKDSLGTDKLAESRVAGEPRTQYVSVWWAGIPMIAAACVFASFLAIIYNYSERLGAVRGFSIETIGSVLSIGMLVGGLGAGAGILLGKRVGRLIPIIIGAVIGCAMVVLLLSRQSGLIGFASGICLFSIVYNFVQPYLWAQTMAIDRSGRVVVVSGLAVALTGVVFAAFVTWVSVAYGVSLVVWIALAEIVICPMFVALSLWFLRHERGSPDAVPDSSAAIGPNELPRSYVHPPV